MELTWIEALALLAVGAVSGALNVLAGGGSFLSLPLLIFLGLPPGVANGTNRVAILVQNMGAVWRFRTHGLFDPAWIPLAAGPAIAGAVLGTWAAIEIGDEAFRRVLAGLMVVATLWILWDPLSRRRGARNAAPDGVPQGGRRAAFAAAFFAVGLYGGFVQAGIGFLLAAVATWAGLDLVRGNALKVLVVLLLTPISLAIFAWSGRVDWLAGLPLAAGHLLGALAGVRWTVLKGHVWIKRFLTVAVVAFAIKLWVAP
ncbi:MAG TPA: sulfite exporter TauE/SafE family protein [Gemmatimonadota bacterium]|nr:sulfite exporter TauE/SafE family protein [Gemmatimonadota bacterium]